MTRYRFFIVAAILTGSFLVCVAGYSFAQQPPTTPAGPPKLALEELATGYTQPLQFAVSPDSLSAVFVVQRNGKVQSLEADEKQRTTILDIQEIVIPGDQLGLLGFAFHPRYNENRLTYAHYIGKSRELENRISEFTVLGTGTGTPDAERKILRISDPGPTQNGGQIHFGPDDYLYIGIGDGGGVNDPKDRGQNTQDHYGSILRIGVEADEATKQAYLAPVDNPYVTNSLGNRDVWATGLRDPRTFTFDTLTRSLWVGDAGNGIEQEINLVRPGGNYGWSKFDGTGCLSMRFECMNQKYLPPVTSYLKKDGTSVVVGAVYHGAALPQEMDGVLVYADQTSGKLWGLKYEGGSVKENRLLLDTGKQVSAIGQDAKGEILLADYQTGGIYRLISGSPKEPPKPPILQKKPVH